MVFASRWRAWCASAIALALVASGQLATPAQAADTERIRVTVPFEPLSGHGAPIVEVRFANGVVGHFMIDTGAAFCCMTDTFARKLGLKSYMANYQGDELHMGSDHGRQSEAVDVKAMDIGTVTLAKYSFVILKNGEFFRFGETPVDGLLGENVFTDAAMLIDYPHDKLTLFFPGGLSDAEVTALVGSDANRIPLRDYSKNRRLGIGPGSNQFITDLTLTNGEKSYTDELIVDTGASRTSISQLAAARLDLRAVERLGEATMGDGSVFSSVAILPQVSAGDLNLAGLKVSYPGRDRTTFPALLGEDILGFCQVLFDIRKNQMYLKPVLPPVNAAAATTPLAASHVDFTRLRTVASHLPIPLYEVEATAAASASGEDTEALPASARVAVLKRGLKGDESDAKNLDRLGNALWESGDRDSAREAYGKSVVAYRVLVAAHKDDAALLAELSIALTDSGNEAEAETVARQALALAPKSPEAQYALGSALLAQALRKLTGESQTVEVSADHLGAFNELIARLRAHPPTDDDRAAAEQLAQSAAASYDRMIALAPDAPQGYRRRADFRSRRGLGITTTLQTLRGASADPLAALYAPEVIDDIEHAADLDPKNVALSEQAAQMAIEGVIYRNERGIDLREGKTWNSLPASARKGAQKQIDRLRALAMRVDGPRAAHAWEALGVIELNGVEDRDAAVEDFKKALNADPTRTRAAYEYASMLRDDRRYDEITTLLQPLVAAHDSATARLYLCYADAHLENWDNAQKNADAALVLQPESFAANLTVAQINLERIATDPPARLRRAGECLDHAAQAMGGKPSGERAAQYRHARAIYDAMNLTPDRARTLALEALEVNRSDIDAREILGALFP